MISALAEEGLAVPAPEETDFSLLDSPYERELIKTLAALPEEIRLAARDYNPNRISGYVTELASRFHRFYTECRIRGTERPLALARLLLTDCARQAIENALSILGVSAPERM